MIKATDLRVGNWLIGKDPQLPNTRFFQVENIEEDKINVWRVDGFGDESAQEVEGIPLIPELLEQCGFEKHSDSVLKYGNSIYWLNAARPVIQISIGYAPVMNITCKYLHQLQNIIFTLTEKEIEINLLSCPTL